MTLSPLWRICTCVSLQTLWVPDENAGKMGSRKDASSIKHYQYEVLLCFYYCVHRRTLQSTLLFVQNGNQGSGKRDRAFCSIFNVQILQNAENGDNLSPRIFIASSFTHLWIKVLISFLYCNSGQKTFNFVQWSWRLVNFWWAVNVQIMKWITGVHGFLTYPLYVLMHRPQ